MFGYVQLPGSTWCVEGLLDCSSTPPGPVTSSTGKEPGDEGDEGSVASATWAFAGALNGAMELFVEL